MANLVTSFVHHSQRKKKIQSLLLASSLQSYLSRGISLILFSHTFGTSQKSDHVIQELWLRKTPNCPFCCGRTLSSTLEQIWKSMNRIGPLSTKLSPGRLKCFNSGMSGLIPERRYWIAFFVLSTSKSSVSQNDTMCKTAIYCNFILFLKLHECSQCVLLITT